jgi:aspartate racemase
MSSQIHKPKHIGIVACSAEGAALCYRTICAEGTQLLGPHAHPEVSMNSQSLADYVACIDEDDWKGVGELMLASANKLARIGAEFLIFPDNTIHQGLRYIQLPLPHLHIANVIAAEAERCGYQRPGLTGTKWLVESDVYPANYVRPNKQQREEINRIIMEELVSGIFKPEAIKYFQEVMTSLKNQGSDAVVLGCTEIPLIMNDANSPLPTLDSTRLLARAALHKACNTT